MRVFRTHSRASTVALVPSSFVHRTRTSTRGPVAATYSGSNDTGVPGSSPIASSAACTSRAEAFVATIDSCSLVPSGQAKNSIGP